MTYEELKQIQLYRQHITDKTDKFTVLYDLNGLQCQFMINAFNALRIRCSQPITLEDFGDGVVKNWTIRGTVHIFNENDLPLYKYQTESRMYLSHNWNTENIRCQCRIAPDRLEYISRLIVDKVSSGITLREELKKVCSLAGVTKPENAFIFDQWGGLLRPLCERGFLCYKVQEKKEFMLCPSFTPMEEEKAILEQAKRYFTNFGPATVRDTAYYFGWTQTLAKDMMAKLPLTCVKINGKQYFYLEQLKVNYPDIPKCVLLAGFDQLMLGYQKQDSIYLDNEYIRGIFNLAGIVMSPILLDGKVVGRWRKKNKKIIFEVFMTVKPKDKKEIEHTAVMLFKDISKIEWAEI